MSPQQTRLNVDVVEVRKTRLLSDETMQELRQCDDPEYVPDTNLFEIMFEDGPTWAKARADRLSAQRTYSDEELQELSGNLAKEMTVQIQQEYDVCLPDNKVSQMYGMSHDFARLALGFRLPAPEGRVPKKGVVMHRKRIREFLKEQQ